MASALLMAAVGGTVKADEPSKAAALNRAPLLESAWVALPLGTVRAEGWLQEMLEMQRDGLTGHAEELQPELGPDSGWKGGTGENGERGPYYLKGLIPLAWQLDDAVLQKRARTWIDAILASQRPDGSYGPASNNDWWPRMVVNHVMRDYHEATGDERVLAFLASYYKYQSSTLGKRPLGAWGRARAGDEIDNVFWLYNRSGDRALLELADRLASQAYPWTEIYSENRFMDYGGDSMPKHAVNVAQALKMPAVYFQRSGKAADREAYDKGIAHLDRDHGLAVGINSGSEMLSGRSTSQGVELCTTVERILSDAATLRVLGDAKIGDSLETMAFNLLPGSFSEDIHQHVYYCIPNNAVARKSFRGFNQDKEDGTVPSHRSGFPCCCFNFNMGWPKLVQNSWAATADGGLAQIAIAPVKLIAKVAGGTQVGVKVSTDYPFNETAVYEITTAREVKFPLSLRIPAWCDGAAIEVNGEFAGSPKAGSFARIERTWKSGDKVRVVLPMQVRTAHGVNGSVSVKRGPLLYSLPVKEQQKELAAGPVQGFEAYEIQPDSKWNHALAVDAKDPASSFPVTTKPMTRRPFQRESTPVRLKARGKLVPQWRLNAEGNAALEPPQSPVNPDTPWTDLELIPFGAGMLRITSFPVLGEPVPPAREFEDSFASGNYNGWLTFGGGWRVKDGKLETLGDVYMDHGSGGSHAVAEGTDFSDLVYEADVLVGAHGDAGLIFRTSNPALGANAYDGYYAAISAGGKSVMLGKAGGEWHPLQIVEYPIEADRSYRLRVEAKGDTIRVFIGDSPQPLITVQDGTYRSGMIGVRRYCTVGNQYGSSFSGVKVRLPDPAEGH
ncbi:glycoside hydrolase family 127 protein [Luteolibacter flavescens]|uniref:Glycoside hydrolase family 127 protein n=1 Tax=Luteolibacter flavescens TaxID=1859460 RepID=A0ABT3FIW2_9BACT|nr:beta-L-arabinofuranosidase domain-containing protein [Luteolibacter flavescens]MCW1883144.1 glycoside hydrolase family 127 protein [Luteolibacter flavescens]